MNTIEIETAQKVIIQYELASVGNRFASFMVDMMILMGILIFLLIIGAEFFGNNWASYQYYLYFTVLPVFLFYTLISEILMDGQTLGKRAMSLKVVKLNGDPASAFDYLIRWAFRCIDIWLSAGSVAALLVSSSTSCQRLGGALSGTTVIRKTSTRNFALKDILSISSREDYEPAYPQVTKMTEQDMLFVKKVLDRFKRYKNNAHKQVVIELSDKMAQLLDIENIPKNKLEFLKILLRDYIVLTR